MYFFRFPIVDLRPLHDPDRILWWKRNVRNDFLQFNLNAVKISYKFPAIIDITSHEVNVFYFVSWKFFFLITFYPIIFYYSIRKNTTLNLYT